MRHNGEGMRSKFLPLKNRQRKIYFLYPVLAAVAYDTVHSERKKLNKKLLGRIFKN